MDDYLENGLPSLPVPIHDVKQGIEHLSSSEAFDVLLPSSRRFLSDGLINFQGEGGALLDFDGTLHAPEEEIL